MKRFVSMALCFVLLCLPSFAHAAVEKYILDNGLIVLVSEMPSSPVAAINFWVKTGSANEGKFMGSGITHFIEHMLFKGTAKRGAGVIPQEARAMGGYINASTGYDNTEYILSVPKENFEKALDLIADMVVDPAFDPVELEREREVIVKEMNMVNDSPDRKLGDLVYGAVYHVHPYQYRIIGREDVFRALKREDLLEYHRTLYVPNNMIISVAGGVKAAAVLSLVKERFKDFKARSFPLRNIPQEPEQIFTRRLESFYPTDLTRLAMVYQGVALLDPDLYALDVLAMALGQGESSRFYLELYKRKHLVEGISAGNSTPQDRGMFEVTALIKGQDPDKVIGAISAMIVEIQQKGLLPDELAKVKRQVMVNNIAERQTAEGMADKAAAEEALTGDAQFSDRYLQGIRAVTNEDIKRVAHRYLIDQRLSSIILKPKQGAEAAVEQKVEAKNDIEKVVLPNGLVLLLKEDHSLPLVSLNVVFNGGNRQEPVELGGLSTLMGSTWSKGLPGKTADQISHDVEMRAASVSSSSGRNTFILGMSFLPEDQMFMLEMLEKFLTAPTFPDVEIARDKEQMRTALAERKDSVLQASSRVLVETLFETHPFRFDSLGSEASLKRITRQDILDCFHRYVKADNGVLAVWGDFDPAQLQVELRRRLGGLKPGKPLIKDSFEASPVAARIKELAMDKDQSAVLFGFRGPCIKDGQRYAADVLVNILSSSLGGRLFKRVRDEFGESYALSGSAAPGVDAGMISFFALTTNEGLAKVRRIMEEEFSKIRSTLVDEKELLDAKIYLKSKLARDQQSLWAQGLTRAVDEALGLGYKNMDDYGARIDAVTRDDVMAVAQQYLDTARAALVLTKTSSKKLGK